MNLRKATLKDIDQCLNLIEDSNYWGRKDFEKSLNEIFIIAEDDGIVGYVIGFVVPTKTTEAMVHECRVYSRERGKGIGTRLVEEFCKEASARGVNIVYAMIDPELRPFYIKSCEFSETGSWIEASKKL